MDEEHDEIASALPQDLDAPPRLGGFRLRGMEITRLETFVDAVFAFAITMLVIAAQQIPDDIETLLAAFKNVPVFVVSFVLAMILPRELIDWSGWVYFSMAILVPLHSAYSKRRIHTLADLQPATRSADMKASH